MKDKQTRPPDKDLRSFSSLLKHLYSLRDESAIEGMARYGIVSQRVYGISAPTLRATAKQIGQDHGLARKLWTTGIHDARALATLIDDPVLVTESQMECWAADFDNWAVCDVCCGHLFDKAPFAWKKAVEWSRRKEEFVKRAGFVLMAQLAVHDKQTGDREFLRFFSLIKREARDERNLVKKAVNWALRQIGKRSLSLNRAAIRIAREIRKIDAPSARWIAADGLRELQSATVQRRLHRKHKGG